MSPGALRIEPLRLEHLPALGAVLRQPAVYEHLGGEVPPADEFELGLQRALAGPPPDRRDEHWLNYLVSDTSGQMLGRLEATVHDGLAEVAFLFGPGHWGHGHAQQGLVWLQAEVSRRCGVHDFWATTVPANQRCQRLLQRCGYAAVTGALPRLLTHDDGDLVFRRRAPRS